MPRIRPRDTTYTGAAYQFCEYHGRTSASPSSTLPPKALSAGAVNKRTTGPSYWSGCPDQTDTAMETNVVGEEPLRNLEQTVSLALRTAHLLTASIQQAEGAVLEAIHGFDSDRDTEEVLVRNAILAAVECPPTQPRSTESFEPIELQPILGLPENLRKCFVLRVLVGMPRQACARLLRLNACAVNDYTCAALQRLAGVEQ